MMTRRTDSFVLTLLMAVALMAGCGKGSLLPQLGEDGRGLPQALVLADSLMNSRPDSALAVLEGAEGDMAGESKSVRMRYQLLRHQAMNKAYVPFTSDSLMLDVADYYDRHGTANERMQAHYLLGCVYRDLKDAPKALSAYHDAVDCADTTAFACDLALLSRVHGQLSALLLNMQLPHEALEEIQVVRNIAKQVGDTLLVLHCLAEQSHAHYLIGNMDSVAILSELASKSFLQHNDTMYSLISLKPAICAYLDMGKLDDAGRLMRNYEKLNDYKQYGFTKLSQKYYYIIKCHLFLAVNQIDSARCYFEKAGEGIIDEKERLGYYRELARYYTQIGMPDSALKYSEKYVVTDDTLYRTSVRKDFQQMHTLYNYEKNKRVAEQSRRELSELRSRIISYILLLFVIVVVAIVLIMRRKRKMDAEHRKLNTKYTESLGQYSILKKETELLEQSKQANEMLIGQLEQEKELHTEAISKLDSKIKKLASTIRQNRESMKKQEYLIASFQKDQMKPGQWKMEESLFNLPLLSHLHKNIAKGMQPSDAQLEEIRQIVETMLPGFIPKIKEQYPQINQTNLMFCIVAKLRFINSERAVIFDMSPQSVTNRCAFLYNKLTGKRGGAVDFESEIQRI